MIKIDNRNIFFDKIKTGINLFTGAGFSVLESPSGNRLPVSGIGQYYNFRSRANMSKIFRGD